MPYFFVDYNDMAIVLGLSGATMQSAEEIANSLEQSGRLDDLIGIYRFLCELHHEDCRS